MTTPETLTVTFTAPLTGGPLYVNGFSSFGEAMAGAELPVQVATVKPVVSANATNYPTATAATLSINGYGFDTTAANDVVTFSDGAAGTVTTATPTVLTVTMGTAPTVAGVLEASVTVNGVKSGATPTVTVATVAPAVTSSIASAAAGVSQTITINGYGFDSTATNDTVTLTEANGTGLATAVHPATAAANQLTLTETPTVAGPLYAVVTVGSAANNTSSKVQVAEVIPTVTASIANLAGNAGSLTINGSGFDTTAANNTVAFNDGAVGAVTSAAAGQLTVTLTGMPTSLGAMNATVKTDGVSSGTAVQVATVTPAVNLSKGTLSASATSLVINGYGFSTTNTSDTVTFTNGTTATVAASPAPTANQITVDVSGLTAGSLMANVTVGGETSTTIQVAAVTPSVSSGSGNALPANAPTVTIHGSGFDPNGTNSVSLTNGGTTWTAAIIAVAPTSLTVSTAGSGSALTSGPLTAIVTTDGQSSQPVEVAVLTPVVTSSTTGYGANAATLTITGYGFSSTAAQNTVSLGGAGGTVNVTGVNTGTSPESMTLAFLTDPTTMGALNATVTTEGESNSTPVQVATIMPAVTAGTSTVAASASSAIVMNGYGFSTTNTNDTVTFTDGATGTVAASPAPTANQFTVSVSGLTAGNVMANVTVGGQTSSTVQVATVTPTVTSSNNPLAANAPAITIGGYGFDPNGTNSVSFTNGTTTWAGTVTSVTSTSLIATISGSAGTITAGPLSAVVTTDGVTSGTPVQVALLTPVVTSSTTITAANAGPLVINGFGFSTSQNTVVLSNGAVGVVAGSPAPTPNSLTVTLLSDPTAVGSMTATVTSNGESGTATQVETVAPVVTQNTSYTISAGAIGHDQRCGLRHHESQRRS